MKKLFSFAIIFFVSIFAPATVFADGIAVTVDGALVIFADQTPAIIDGRTLVPVRGVFEHLGFDVDWDDDARAVVLTRYGFDVIITLDSEVFTTNGVSHTFEVPAQSIGGRTMIPIREVVESVGYDVDWDGATQTVLITFPCPSGFAEFNTEEAVREDTATMTATQEIEPEEEPEDELEEEPEEELPAPPEEEPAPAPSRQFAEPSLAAAFADYFIIGNIWQGHMGNNRILDNPGTDEHFLHHYNAITAENHHKPNNFATQANFANPAAWNWAESDFIVNWAYENNLYMVGHVLVWHSQSHPWFTTDLASNRPLTRAEAAYNMEHHINAVAGRYRGRVDVWEVINEVFVGISPGDWNSNPDWRSHLRRANSGLNPRDHSQWYNAFATGRGGGECGSDFIYYAFRFARIADPNALLKYNDYGEYNLGKREAIAQMAEQLNERWRRDPLYDGRLLVEILGMQGHYSTSTDLRQVRATIERFVATGARVHITELDIQTPGLFRWGTDTFHSPAARRLTDAELRSQANRYRDLFALFMEYSDYIDRVTFWGIADQWSWLSPTWPLPFELDGGEIVPKPAFWSILELVN
ncbi:MAG: endo-1,4-beta-xylanase [Defluviitaleaceae bacterium]|nr:endo-1,4-beta-xylanase [Defluviitaleaceae bacterium]